MICPYYKKIKLKRIECKRGHSHRTKLFTTDASRNSHIERHCMSEYRECETYKKLEKDWGIEKC